MKFQTIAMSVLGKMDYQEINKDPTMDNYSHLENMHLVKIRCPAVAEVDALIIFVMLIMGEEYNS